MRESFLQYFNLFATHWDNPLQWCSKSAFKKSEILSNTRSIGNCEKSVGKMKSFTKNGIILKTTYLLHWIYLFTRKYRKESAQLDVVLNFKPWKHCRCEKQDSELLKVKSQHSYFTVQKKRQLVAVFWGQ